MVKEYLYKQLLEREKELIEELNAIKVLKEHYEKEGIKTINVSQSNSSFENYNKEWTHPEKALYVLTLIKKGTAKNVAEKLHEIDPKSFDLNKAQKICTVHLSSLFKEGKIGAEKRGRKNIYYIK